MGNPLLMAIFNSYVSLPEGNPRLFLWIKHIQKSPTWQWHEGHKPRDAPPYDRVDLGWRANRHLWCCRTAGSALPRPGTAGFWMVLDWGTVMISKATSTLPFWGNPPLETSVFFSVSICIVVELTCYRNSQTPWRFSLDPFTLDKNYKCFEATGSPILN